MTTDHDDEMAFRRSSRRTRLRLLGLISVTLLTSGFLFATAAPAAYATKYPSWADVVAARHNAAKARAEVATIKKLVSSLDGQLKSAQATAAADGKAANLAQQKYFAGESKEQTLEAQVKVAQGTAARSKKEIGEYASQLSRTADGPGGTSLSLFLQHASSRQLLDSLGAIRQVSRQEGEDLQQALSQQNSVAQLRSLATDQSRILAAQKKAADAAEATATAAAEKLQTAVIASTVQKKKLTLELAALTTQKNMTEKGYAAGVRASIAAGGGGQGGVANAAGWALPTVGVITSPWGYRFDPAAGYSWRMHYGDDIADGCLRPIYAAHSGTVSYVGPYGDIGNYIIIQNGGGISTAYGHIANGETFVRIGQQVSGGQNIARTGSTGTSTGCHLYFQVMVNGNPVNPAPFMRARGITLG